MTPLQVLITYACKGAYLYITLYYFFILAVLVNQQQLPSIGRLMKMYNEGAEKDAKLMQPHYLTAYVDSPNIFFKPLSRKS